MVSNSKYCGWENIYNDNSVVYICVVVNVFLSMKNHGSEIVFITTNLSHFVLMLSFLF